MLFPGEELYGEKPLFNRFSRRDRSFPPPGVFLEKRVVLAQTFPALKTGREWSYYEHITSAILDQKQATEKVCRSSGIGKLFEFIEESAIAKKFSPPIFSPLSPGGHGRGRHESSGNMLWTRRLGVDGPEKAPPGDGSGGEAATRRRNAGFYVEVPYTGAGGELRGLFLGAGNDNFTVQGRSWARRRRGPRDDKEGMRR